MEKPEPKIRYDWNDIVYFLEVARQRNLVRAAQKLKVNHTTVSRRIRELERCLNSTLFKRNKSGFFLTEIGLNLLQYAEGMESNANSVIEAIGTGRTEASGPVRLAAMEGIGSFYLTRCIGDFNKIYPSIRIELITDTRLLDLSRREGDVFISFSRPKGKRLQIKRLGEFKISLYSSGTYFNSREYPRTAKELEKQAFIDFIDDHIYSRENRWLSDIVRPAHVVFRSTSLVAQYLAISDGQGIGMLPSYIAAANPDLRPVMPELFTSRDIWFSIHEDLLHIGRIKVFVRYLEKRLKQDHLFLMGLSDTRHDTLQKSD